jgi:hypothetical protein
MRLAEECSGVDKSLPRPTGNSHTSLRNDQLQPTSDPPLTLSLRAQDGEVYVLPLSERGAARVWEVISLWRQGQRFGDSEAFGRANS